MTDDDRAELNEVLSKNLDAIWDEFTEQSARLSALRFLLEDLFADKYSDRLPEFNARMEQLLHLTRAAPVKGGPMTDDAAVELQARISTHLERFRTALRPRIQARSSR